MFLTDGGRSDMSPLPVCVQLFMLAMFPSSPGWLFKGTLAELRFDFEPFGSFTVSPEEPA